MNLTGRVRVLATLPVGLLIQDISQDGRVLVERYDSKPGIPLLVAGEARERDLTWFDRSSLVALSDDGGLALINEFGDAAGTEGAHYLRKTDGSPAVKLGAGAALDLSADGKWVLARKPGSESSLVLTPSGTGTPVTIEEPGFEAVAAAVLFPGGNDCSCRPPSPGTSAACTFRICRRGNRGPSRPRATDSAPARSRPTGSGSSRTETGAMTPPSCRWRVESRAPSRNTKDLDFLQWAPDGKFLYAALTGSIPAKLVRVEVATGRREPWKSLAPPDLSGLIDIGTISITPDGRSYAYGYGRSATSDLYLIEGLK